ncbi:MAG TPA: ABC transporter ATP-binding protein/permease [Bryobacteraceae bacterium]|nr:ABC transporter ATP-binding protein/permease [Bryobacteraceae bacterium]
MRDRKDQKGFGVTSLRQLLRDAWALSHPYWFSEERWAARGLLLVVIALNLGIVYINVLLNKWNNAFYDALQYKEYSVFFHQLIRFSWLAALFIVFAVYQSYLNQMLQIRWRSWFTERYLRAWLSDNAYYRMQVAAGETDNPDQRVAEDINLFISNTLNLGIGGMRAVVTLISFVAILWGLSGTLTIPLDGSSIIKLHGYLVWAALLYALAATWITDWIGRPLVRLNFDQQRYEADFRFSLVRFRENAEGVALYHGEADELRAFRERFAGIVRNFWGIMRRQKRLTWFTAGYSQAAVIFPFVVVAPRYFRGQILLGGLMQTAAAFGQVQDSLSFIVSSYTDIAAWRSVVERLTGFQAAIERARLQAPTRAGIRHGERDGGGLSVDGVELDLPSGKPLIADVNLLLGRGDSALLSGPSGAGKSTLLRAIAGIWPFGRGEIDMPANAHVLFLPQKPYLPIRTLREVVKYPIRAMRPKGAEDATLREALEAVGLPHLAGRLDETEHWALQLSPGEQQRIAFARALVQKPDWLFLDEATSAVDEATEARLYGLVRDRLPATTLFSVGHRTTLRPFHVRKLVVQPDGDGPASIVEETVLDHA